MKHIEHLTRNKNDRKADYAHNFDGCRFIPFHHFIIFRFECPRLRSFASGACNLAAPAVQSRMKLIALQGYIITTFLNRVLAAAYGTPYLYKMSIITYKLHVPFSSKMIDS
jgi:hypothetical protein